MDNNSRFSGKCSRGLYKHAQKVSQDWGFSEWFNYGVDMYIAQEILYLTTEFLGREDYDDADKWIYDEIHSHRPSFIGRMAYGFVFVLDDFPRLWNVNEKVNVAREFATWLRESSKKPKSRKSQKGARES